MKIIAAGLAALFITVSPLTQPLAHASSSGGYSGGAKHGPLPGQVFGHRGARARGQAGGAAYAASLPNESGAPNGGFFVNGIFYPHGTPENIWRKW
jgi:hypothetical protein